MENNAGTNVEIRVAIVTTSVERTHPAADKVGGMTHTCVDAWGLVAMVITAVLRKVRTSAFQIICDIVTSNNPERVLFVRKRSPHNHHL